MPLLSEPDSAVLLDLDGTLLDTAPDFVSALKILAAETAAEMPDELRIRRVVSDGATALVTLLCGQTAAKDRLEQLRLRLLEIYGRLLGKQTRYFPGGAELIDTLDKAGIPWGIVTNKPEQFARPLLSQLAVDCRVLICPEHISSRKPDPEPALKACRQLQCKPQNSLFVGDHWRDIQCGRNAGMVTAVAAWGYIDPATELSEWHADYVLDSIYQLRDMIAVH